MAIKADFKPYYSVFVFVGHSVSTIKGNIAITKVANAFSILGWESFHTISLGF